MIVEAVNISKAYRNVIGSIHREVLINLSLKISPADKIAIMGPSGSGKTTLLNLIGSLDRPDGGQIRIDGRALSEMNEEEILTYRNRKIGFIFQFHHLLPQCTLWENVLLPTLPHKSDKKLAEERAGKLLELMGVWEPRFNKPGELSGGECQRAAVARALINQPDLLLADEPTGSLDEKNADRLMELLENVNQQMGVSLVIATHSREIADRMDRIYEIHNGQLK